jgi:co-chaperonin GroES (HSP10)
MTSLILPEHVAKKVGAKKEAPAVEETKSPLEEAYILAEERVLDPEKLSLSVLQRLPQPTGWRLLVLPYRGVGRTKGNVHLPDEYVERQTLATVVGYVLAVGPDCYTDKGKFTAGPWCKKGDWILFGRYAGARFKIEGGEVRILNDDEVIATIADPADVLNV